jgi:predicted nucleic acid-binding protein
MKYLVDANVLCEPTRPAPNAGVISWLIAHEGEFVVDSIVLGEILTGILLLRGGKKRTRLEKWFMTVVQRIDCLAWDANVGLRWASLIAELNGRGVEIPLLDGMIAATALTHDLTVVTRNTRDFERAGARVLDPFA